MKGGISILKKGHNKIGMCKVVLTKGSTRYSSLVERFLTGFLEAS
jgi:hypothetical protein